MRAPNGKLIVGTLESVYGVAQIDEESTLEDICYDGYTDINWDSQESVIKDGGRTFIDEDGHEWHEDQLKLAAVIAEAINAPEREVLQECKCNETDSFCPQHNGKGCEE